jgi:hypothetical protein
VIFLRYVIYSSAWQKVNLYLCIVNQVLYHEDIWGSGDIATFFMASALVGGEWSASHLCRFISQGKSPLYPFNRRLGEPHIRSGSCGEEKTLEHLGIKPETSSQQTIGTQI